MSQIGRALVSFTARPTHVPARLLRASCGLTLASRAIRMMFVVPFRPAFTQWFFMQWRGAERARFLPCLKRCGWGASVHHGALDGPASLVRLPGTSRGPGDLGERAVDRWLGYRLIPASTLAVFRSLHGNLACTMSAPGPSGRFTSNLEDS